MALETWLAFFVACWVISLSPGAGAVASMSAGMQYGFWRGYWNALGLQLGLVLQIAALSIGAGVLFSSVGHGSAFDIAGKGVADPVAVIETLSLLYQTF